MKVDWMTVHCNERQGNEYPRVANICPSGEDVALSLTCNDFAQGKLTFFMTEQDMVNFKNSVISAVDNYKRGK